MAFKFLKKGSEVQEAVAQAEAMREARLSSNRGPWRYWLRNDNEGRITFLDGNLGEDGSLETVSWWEHNLKINGRYGNFFPCTQDIEPCPICEMDMNPSLVFGFTVIDHVPYTVKSGPNEGNVIVNTRKFFVCKRDTYKTLSKLAMKRNGLRGCTFDVIRTGDKSPSVGSQFDFDEKLTDSELKVKYGLSEEDIQPFNYEEIIVYKSADELRSMGYGTSAPLGYQDKPELSNISGEDLEQEL